MRVNEDIEEILSEEHIHILLFFCLLQVMRFAERVGANLNIDLLMY